MGGSTTHQLAVYPGGGARYVRHADASLSCPTRAVTAIVYLNEQDWDPQVGRAGGGEAGRRWGVGVRVGVDVF